MRYIVGKCATKWSVSKQCEVNDISWLVNNTSYSMWTFDRNYARNTNYNPGFSFDEAIEFIMNNDNYANFIVGSFHVYGTTISKLNNLKDCSYE